MNGKKVAVLSLAGVLAVSMASCKKGESWQVFTKDSYTDSQVAASTNGTYKTYVEESYEDRTEILAALEKYAASEALTGISLYNDDGLVMISDTFELGVEEYVTGYGFGYYSDGKVVKDMPGQANEDWKRYFHTAESDDFKHLNYMNDKGSVVGGYNPLVASSYFGTRLNSDKNGYEWFPSLASDYNKIGDQVRPLPVVNGAVVNDESAISKQYTTYRIYLRDGLQYKIASQNDKVKGFNNREIAPEDYLTPYLELFDASNGLARGGENLTGAASIKGMADYSEYTSQKRTVAEKKAWMEKNGGVHVGSDTNGDYIELEFNTPCIPFYAMYYASSSLYTPIPYDFLDAIGGIKIWGSSNDNNTLSPVDTTLSTGPFVVENYQTGVQIVFKNADQNAALRGGENVYNPTNMPGIYVKFLSSMKSDPLAAYKEFKDTKTLSVCGVPKDKIQEEKDKSYTKKTEGSSVFKLNVNTTTQEEWVEMFGENGSVVQTQPSNYYQTKPIMSNEDFIKGVTHSINRVEYAAARGKTGTLEYFSNNYLSNPEQGESYNSTQAHKDVMKEVYGEDWNNPKTLGYDFDLAVKYFKAAADKLKADGTYKVGDTITLDVWWQTDSAAKNDGAPLTEYIVKAWNAADTGITLKFNNTFTAIWSDVYYKKMLVGQFDFAIGGISGNSLNPINFMEVLKSDNSSGFTLNWGPNTNGSADISYDGENFTYDALYQAADTGAVVDNNGRLAKAVDAKLVSNTLVDNSRVVKINVATANFDALKANLKSVTVAWYEDPDTEGNYSETTLTASDYKLENGVLTITVPAEIAEKYKGLISFDLLFEVTTKDNKGVETKSNKLVSLSTYFWMSM